ncbi:hypothetical protein FRC07_007818, partial [Ceratobasidium sp. 392]
MSNYIGFQCDYSDQGTLEVTMEVLKKKQTAAGGKKPKKPKTPDSNPTDDLEFEEIKVLVPLWLPLVKDKDGQEVTEPGTYFVSCRTGGMGFEIFIEQSELEKRIPKKYPACQEIYDKDFNESKENNGLDCVGYDDDGLIIGTRGARTWPRGEFVPRTTLEPIPRYYAQAAIWQSIITTSTTAGSSRLWKPTAWNEAPLKIWFTPCEAWLPFGDLKKITDAIKKEEKKKESSQTSKRLGLTTWLDWDVPNDAAGVD